MPQLSRLANDPLAMLDDDYAEAVVHLAWAVDRKTKARILLCAAVELLPNEIPPPVLRGERCMKSTASCRFFVYAQEVIVSARRGLTWFDDAARGIALKPDGTGTFGEATDPNSPRFVLQPLGQEPLAPSLLTARTIVPFATDWHGSLRVRHLVPEVSPFQDWTAQELSGAIAWLRTDLHLDLEMFPEYAGSVHLLAPNPVFRSLFVRQDLENGGPALIVALTARTGRSLAGLDLIIEEKRATGIGILAHVAIAGQLIRVELPHAPELIRERVIDSRRGLLFEGDFGVFIRGFGLTVEVASTMRRVELSGPTDTYEIPVLGGFRTESRVGAASDEQSASSILSRASADRERKARGSANQKWFRDQAPDAGQALRDIVGPAKGTVLFCDPYFGGDDLRRVAFAISDPTTEVRILTSSMFLGQGREGGSEGTYLRRCLDEARRKLPINPILVHVMPGAAIHDRFLVTGERMWMVGSSINNFGQRGSLMVTVPDPIPVQEDLDRVWAASVELSAWLATRKVKAVT